MLSFKRKNLRDMVAKRTIAIIIVIVYVVLVLPMGYCAMLFMNNTKLIYRAPKGSMVANAKEVAFQHFTNGQVFQNPVFIVAQTRNGSDIIQFALPELCALTAELYRLKAEYSDHILDIQGYCIKPSIKAYRDALIGGNNQESSLLVMDMKAENVIGLSKDVRNAALSQMKSFAAVNATSLTIRTTSTSQISEDLEGAVLSDTLMIDAFAFPLASIAMACCLGTIKMILLPLITIPVTIFLAFTICYPISVALNFSSFAPEMASAVMVAISIDYSLFILSRFRELSQIYRLGEDTAAGRFEVVKETTRRSAHNILVSGLTISVALGGLALLPSVFVNTIGICFFVGAITAVFVSLTLMPSMLLVFFDFFSTDIDWTPCLRCCPLQVTLFFTKKLPQEKNDPLLDEADRGSIVQSSLKSVSPHRGGGVNESVYANSTYGSTLIAPTERPEIAEAGAAEQAYILGERTAQYKSPWFRVGRYSYHNPVVVALCVLFAGSLLFYFAGNLKTNFALFATIPRSSPHAATLKYIMTDIGGGASTPFYVTIDSKKRDGLLNSEVFTLVQLLADKIHDTTGQPRDRMMSFAYLFGIPLTFDESRFAVLFDRDYQFVWNRTVDKTNRVGLIVLNPAFDPFDSEANDYLNHLHDTLASFDTKGLLDLGFMGASADSWAIMHVVLHYFPMQIGITFGIIFVFISAVFRSVYIPFRMLLTVSYTLGAAFGIGVLFFQYDWSHSFWPALHGVKAYTWIVPIFAFSLLCALALDYDVFLLTRLVEYKKAGFSHEAAMAKAVWKTGRVVSYAGIVMAISFGGLMFSEITMMNMFGLISTFAVLVDTFVIRTFLVPALMSLKPEWSWWPRRFPEITRGMDDFMDLGACRRRNDPPVAIEEEREGGEEEGVVDNDDQPAVA